MSSKYVFPTMITPFNADGSVDYATCEKYVQWYYDKGCNGIFAVCQSSEMFYLSLEERIKLNSVVWNKVKEIEKNGGRKMIVVSSGHIADSIDEQIYELNKIAETGTDAIIFLTNRLDINDEGDDVWIKNAEKLISGLPQDLKLGLYECPYPYKRLVTPKILQWCLDTERFFYMKDTCCDAEMLDLRIKALKGSNFKLLNANSQTLLDSLQSGGDGYCGVMANFHPELYVWLCENFEKEPEKAKIMQGLLATTAFTELCLPYPLTAKYHMCLEGIETENHGRSKKASELTDYAKSCIKQMRNLCNHMSSTIIKG
jgi:4-hydroxy-tetrahydrodipicolinate synthase